MTTLIPRPTWACAVWADGDAIYVEPPCPEGKPPVITAFTITEAGFAKALAFIVAQSGEAPKPAMPLQARREATKAPPKPKKSKAPAKPSILEGREAISSAMTRLLTGDRLQQMMKKKA